MRRLALTVPPLALSAVVALSLGCSSSESAVTPRAEAERAGRIAFADELAGRDLVTETSGPWQMRKSAGARGDAAGERARAAGAAFTKGGAPTSPGGESPEAVVMELHDRSEGAAPPPAKAMDGVAESAPTTGGGSVGTPGPPGDAGDDLRVEASELLEARDAETETTAETGSYDSDVAGKPRASARGAAPAQRLRAGATDDNVDYDAYLAFLATWVDQKQIRELYHPLDVSDRRHVRVVDANGAPVPGAVVSIVDIGADRVLWTGTTYGDGRIPYYPNLDTLTVGESSQLVIEAYVRNETGAGSGARAPWTGAGTEVEIALTETVAAPDPVQLDVCFVIDTTGSMGDEIASIKASLLRVTEKLRSLEREFDLRYSAVLYRDIGDEYVTATHAFTADIEAFDEALRSVQAAGGGDGPESLNQALAQAVDGVAWRPKAAKVAFLIADAQPHMDYEGDISYGESVRAAVAKGIRIHSVAASGLDPVGTLVFRQIAQFTRGRFIFIEYGTPAVSAASHGVEGDVKSDNLEDILFAQLRDEVATYGRGN